MIVWGYGRKNEALILPNVPRKRNATRVSGLFEIRISHLGHSETIPNGKEKDRPTADLSRSPLPSLFSSKKGCEITIISFSRSICRGGLATLIGVTGKPYPSCLSCHSHPIRPFRAPSPRGEGCDTRIPSSKKGGEAATRALNLEP